MKTIVVSLFIGLLLLSLTQWPRAGFLLSNSDGWAADDTTGKVGRFAYDIRFNTYYGREQIVRQGALEALKVVAQRWYMGSSAPAGSIDVEYFHVQLGEHDAAVHISSGARMNYGSGGRMAEWRGCEQLEYRRDRLQARIKVYPKIFDKRAYWIAAENRWAETAVEAVKDLVLEGLAHVERYIYEQTDPPVRLLAAVPMSGNEMSLAHVPLP